MNSLRWVPDSGCVPQRRFDVRLAETRSPPFSPFPITHARNSVGSREKQNPCRYSHDRRFHKWQVRRTGAFSDKLVLTEPKPNLSLVVLFQKVTLKVYSEKSIVEQIQETLAHLHEIFVRSANAQVLLDGLSFDY